MYRERSRKLAKEIEEGPITRQDIIRGHWVIKLAKKYGPAETVLLLTGILVPIYFAIFLVLHIAFSIPLESIIIAIFGTIFGTVMAMKVLYQLLSQAVSRYSEG